MGQYVTRAWIVSRSVSPSLSPLLPCLHVGHVHRIRVHVSFFKSFATAAKRIPFRPAASYTVFVKSLARSPGYYHWTRIICAVGRLMAVDEREEAFNNGEGVRFIRDFFLLSLINAVTLIYNLAIRVVF